MCIYMYIYICMYIYVYMYIYMYTYIYAMCKAEAHGNMKYVCDIEYTCNMFSVLKNMQNEEHEHGGVICTRRSVQHAICDVKSICNM